MWEASYCVQSQLLHEPEKHLLREIHTRVMLRVKVVLVDIYLKQSTTMAAMLPSILQLSHSPINSIFDLYNSLFHHGVFQVLFKYTVFIFRGNVFS